MSNAPLWSDERINKELGITSDVMIDYAESFNVGLDGALKMLRNMRDEYEADRRTEQPATPVGTQWVPVEDGEYKCLHERNLLAVEGNSLSVEDWDDKGKYWASADLPDDYRLCRRAEQPAPQGAMEELETIQRALLGWKEEMEMNYDDFAPDSLEKWRPRVDAALDWLQRQRPTSPVQGDGNG